MKEVSNKRNVGKNLKEVEGRCEQKFCPPMEEADLQLVEQLDGRKR